jgi:hypothetical protein
MVAAACTLPTFKADTQVAGKKLIQVLNFKRPDPRARLRRSDHGAALSGRLPVTGAASGLRVRIRLLGSPTWPCQCPPSRPPADSGSHWQLRLLVLCLRPAHTVTEVFHAGVHWHRLLVIPPAGVACALPWVRGCPGLRLHRGDRTQSRAMAANDARLRRLHSPEEGPSRMDQGPANDS